jgi:hypothetical protein
MLMPAGIPEPAKEITSKLVKSGLRNLSFSNELSHGNFGIMLLAASTRAPNALVRSKLTVAAKPEILLAILTRVVLVCEFQTFPLSSDAMGITISLNKADV